MGAKPGTDISNIIEDANNYLRTTGGEIYIPSGTYYLQDAEILSNVKYKGAGWKSTVLALPAGATKDMFIVKEQDVVIEMSGFEDLHLKGLGKSGPNGINMSKASYWHFGHVKKCRIENFNIGLRGSARDRRPYMSFCQFWLNEVGYYAAGDHPQILSCDFRQNTIGLSGDKMYDMQVCNTTFAYNTNGVLPDPAIALSYIRQTLFTSCQFFSNTIGGATVGGRVTFSNCLMAAANGIDLDTSFGVKFIEPHSAWLGGIVNQEIPQAWFGDAVFLINTGSDICIKDVEFVSRHFIKTSASKTHQRHIFSGNNGFCRGKFLSILSDVNGNQGLSITGNSIQVSPVDTLLTTGDGIIEIDKAHPSIGNIIKDNVIQSLTANFPANSIKADMRQSICKNNITRNVAAIVATVTNAGTVNTENLVS